MNELRVRWQETLGAWGTPAVREGLYEKLAAAYTAPDRHYHDLRHIADCLRELDAARALAHDPRAIETAIFFHDVVYDGRRTDNEERSALVAAGALRQLGAGEVFIGEISRLILFTRHDIEPTTDDGKLMVDIDLASLALPAEQFDENSRRIRREYLHVDDATFVQARNAMLGGLLQRPRIYYTDVFFQRCEERARGNLERVTGKSEGRNQFC